MQRIKLSAALTASLALAPAAIAQEYNVDLNTTGHPIPSQAFGGFLQQLGFWNAWTPVALHPSNPISLAPVVGTTANSVVATTSTLNQSMPMVTLATGIVPSVVEPLFGDYLDQRTGGAVLLAREVSIDDLLPAEYLVNLYSWSPGSGGAKWRARTHIGTATVSTSPWQDLLYGSSWPGGTTVDDAYVRPGFGTTHHNMATFVVDVQAGETLELEAYCGLGSGGPNQLIVAAGGSSIPAGGGTQTGNGQTKGPPYVEIIPASPGDGSGCVLNGYQLTPLVGDSFCAQPLNTRNEEMRLVAWGTSINGEASLLADDLTIALGVVEDRLPMPGTAVYTLVSLDSTAIGVVHGCPRIGPLCIGTSSSQNITVLSPPGVASASGTYSRTVPFSSIGGAVMVGSQVNIQCYYHDVSQGTQCANGTGTPVLRLSNALAVTLY